MTDSSALEAATLNAQAARRRLTETTRELQQRLAPARLLDDAVASARVGAETLAQTSIRTAQRRPGIAAGVAAAVALLLLRHPIGRLRRRLLRRRKETD